MYSPGDEQGVDTTVDAPGLVLLPRQGAPRLLGRPLLEHLGLERLPPVIESAAGLMREAGFRSRPGALHLWQREGRTIYAGEFELEDGARLLWTWPAPGSEEATRRHVRYLSLASHDLRGALANIRSYAGLLLSGRIQLEPKVQRGMETIARNADRALAFAQDFFDSSRADLGALAYEKERQPLEPLLAAAVKRHQATAESASVALLLDAPSDIPDVDIDGGRIQHAVEAFIQYHLAHAQAGEEIHVGARATPAGGLRVDVRRRGAPMSEEDAALVFQREERAFREKKLEDPLRISLARQEVEMHGGLVGVETDVGGATLFFTLPTGISPELTPPVGMQP